MEEENEVEPNDAVPISTANSSSLPTAERVCYGRWSEYEMIYSFLTGILDATDNKPVQVTKSIEVRVNMSLGRTALHAMLCTGFIESGDLPRISQEDRDHPLSNCVRNESTFSLGKSDARNICIHLLVKLKCERLYKLY